MTVAIGPGGARRSGRAATGCVPAAQQDATNAVLQRLGGCTVVMVRGPIAPRGAVHTMALRKDHGPPSAAWRLMMEHRRIDAVIARMDTEEDR